MESSFNDLLRCYFEANDLEGFRQTLEKGASVNGWVHERSGWKFSIFELVCEKPGSKEYIKACKEHSADCHAQNPCTKDYPIHLAARSLDVGNLQALLEGSTHLLFIDAKNEDKTALFTIFAGLKLENRANSMNCIHLLLAHGANINATNARNIPPIKYLVDLVEGSEVSEELRRTIREDIVLLLSSYRVDLTFRSNQVEFQLQKLFPDIPKKLIRRGSKVTQGSIEGLRNLLSRPQTVDEAEFLRHYREQYLPTTERSNDTSRIWQDHEDLLLKTVEIGCLEISKALVEELQRRGLWAKETSESVKFYSLLLEKCCHRRHDKLLKFLLEKDPKAPIIPRLLLNQLILGMLVDTKQNSEHQLNDFTKCLNILLVDARININATDDQRGPTALYYAAKYGHDGATRELLQNGAFIGAQNVRYLPLQWISEEQLESHLDSCISSEGLKPDQENLQPSEENFKVQFDVKNFFPPEELRKTVSEILLQLEELPHTRRLLLHPVPATLLMLEWRKLWVLLCLNFAISFGGCATLILTLWLRPIDRNGWHYAAALTALIYFSLRESVQMYSSGLALYRSNANWVELCLIGFTIVSLALDIGPIVALFLAAAEIMILFSSLELHSFSTTLLTLRMVAINLLKLLFLFSGLVAAVAGSFNYLLGEDEPPEDRAGSVEDDNWFKRFERMPLAFVKSLIMITGHFEVADLGLERSTSTMLFSLCFLFIYLCLTILMGGEAVNQTLQIKSDEKLLSIKRKLLIIKKYEKWVQAWHNAVGTSKRLNQRTGEDAPLAQTKLSWSVSFESNQSKTFSLTSLLLGRNENRIDETILQDALRVLRNRNKTTLTSIEARLSSVEKELKRLTETHSP